MKLPPITDRAVKAALLRMCERSTFFATLALWARFEASTSIPTAATDGRSVFVNPQFFDALTPDEQTGIVLHEVLHAALLHVPRRGGRDPKLWNIAADIVINGMIVREGYTLPQGGLRDARGEHLGVEEVYELLLRDAQAQQQQQAGQPDDLLDDAPPDATSSAGTSQAEKAEAQAAQERHWRAAQEQAQLVAQEAGTLPQGIARELQGVTGPCLPWRSYLWRYLTQTPTDFSAFDRRFVGSGLYLDALAGESVEVLLCVDTSGSINQELLRLFLGEVQGVLAAYPHLRCELYYADAALYGPHRLTARSPIPEPQGGGGTDFQPFFAAAARHPFAQGRTVAIYLTDGWGQFPQPAPRLPVLWVVTPGGRDVGAFPFGEAVRLLGAS